MSLCVCPFIELTWLHGIPNGSCLLGAHWLELLLGIQFPQFKFLLLVPHSGCSAMLGTLELKGEWEKTHTLQRHQFVGQPLVGWTHFDPFWAILDPFGAILGHFRPIWGTFLAFSDSFEAPRSHLRPILASKVTQIDQKWSKMVQNGSKRGPKRGPKGGPKMGPPEVGTKKKSKNIFSLAPVDQKSHPCACF